VGSLGSGYAAIQLQVFVTALWGGGDEAGHNPSVALSVVSHTDEGKERVWVPKLLPGI